ncbi:MAG: epoxyqueuosine reductase QueH [Actinobacteria bacterium]|nr:epoxyqueuosine reductase QueH [Actinomycetota bacterium]MCL5886823.1 epoxyqueuosine reductase QueH [Actinomycetota bacterium]
MEPLDIWSDSFEVEVFFFNPNIHPTAEHELRREALQKYADAHSILIHDPGYRPLQWIEAVGSDETNRCKECYMLRLAGAAKFARDNVFDVFATTLAVSPYQNQGDIAAAGEMASKRFGIPFVYSDMTDRHRSAVERSRAMGMYRQNYCGCAQSMPKPKLKSRKSVG